MRNCGGALHGPWRYPLITFDGVTKRFPDGTIAVSDLDLEIGAGELAVFVGPSGCGKTTTLRMINRMIERSGGRLEVDGRSVDGVPTAQLRRSIGYVIQQIGLFPHLTVAQNIATVPSLVGWDRARSAARLEELLALVGLPGAVADRFPHQLSGGQRQRVGVARALAVDPPILLMDEPFGAVDPIVRGRLQTEFAALQRQLGTTVAFVTHDIEEAITLGDRVAVFGEGGVLQQFAPPADLLAAPANAFVEDFLGEERGLRRLALVSVEDVQAEPGPVVSPLDSPERARGIARDHDTDWVVVVGGDGVLRGWTDIAALDGQQRVAEAEVHPFQLQVSAADSLRAALNAMVSSRSGVAVRTDAEGRYEGLLTRALLSRQVR